MQSRSYYFLLIVLGLGLLFGFLFTQGKPQYGLDVQGGVRFVYQIQFDADPAKAATQRVHLDEIRANVHRVIENRIAGLGVAEGTILDKGEDQFVIELPGYTNVDEAEKIISTTASIRLYHARTLQTKKRSYRTYGYSDGGTMKDGSPFVVFSRGTSGKTIGPGDPEYKQIIEGWDLILQGDDLASAAPEQKGDGWIPQLNFSGSGSKKIEAWSRRFTNDEEPLAFVLDNVVLSVAPLAPGAIISDQGIIQGKFSVDYVKRFTDLLNSGALPVDLQQLSKGTVDPTIGKYALNQLEIAGAVAFGLIVVFLCAYYAFPGLVATVALCLYVLFTLTTLKLMHATFSLAAIAGFILSVGMAVDANILVFERFKEEMKSGKSLKSAMELGFRRALNAIIDSNACTILTALVLVGLGTGPVKNFAATLIVGVAISLFTAFSVTRSLLMFLAGSGIADKPSLYAVDRTWFPKLEARADHEPLRVVEKAKKWFLISGATVVIGAIFAFPPFNGFKLNVEFRGGVESQYAISDASLSGSTIAHNLEAAGYKGSNVQFSTDKNGQRIAILTLPASPEFKTSPTNPLSQVVQKIATAGGITGQNISFTDIGPAIQKETIVNAVKGVILSSLLIIVYLAFRFGFSVGGFVPGLRFSVAAIGALIHDVLVVIFLAALVGYFMHWEISALFVTSMLTIIGFSVHDTIVIFDRIRENLRKAGSAEEFGHLMDRSITQSFTRSINTSMTVIATLAILVIFGTATVELKFFCVAMLVGITSGTYSSIYNASPILYLYENFKLRKGPEHTLVGMALAENARTRIISTRADGPPSGPTPPTNVPTSPQTGRTYGQVKRRANQQRGRIELDD